jgi:hypothetical protein
MTRWCKKEARCGRCAATAHEGGEENCPSNTGEVPKRCPVCGKDHRVWDRKCPEATKYWNTVREAYTHHPARFEDKDDLREPISPKQLVMSREQEEEGDNRSI